MVQAPQDRRSQALSGPVMVSGSAPVSAPRIDLDSFRLGTSGYVAFHSAYTAVLQRLTAGQPPAALHSEISRMEQLMWLIADAGEHQRAERLIDSVRGLIAERVRAERESRPAVDPAGWVTGLGAGQPAGV